MDTTSQAPFPQRLQELQVSLFQVCYHTSTSCIPTHCFLFLSSDASDFQPINQLSTGGEIQFFTTNDEITLELDDTVLLIYEPLLSTFAAQLEDLSPPEFLRNTSTVSITDNDRKNHTTLNISLVTGCS